MILKQMCAVKLTIFAYLLKLPIIRSVHAFPKRDSSLSISVIGIFRVLKRSLIQILIEWIVDPKPADDFGSFSQYGN